MEKPSSDDRHQAAVYLIILTYAVPMAVLVGTGTHSALATLLTTLATAGALHYVLRVYRDNVAALRGLAWGGGLFTLLASFPALEKETGCFPLLLAVFAGFIFAVILTETAEEKAQADHDPFDDEDDSSSASKRHADMTDPDQMYWWLRHHRE